MQAFPTQAMIILFYYTYYLLLLNRYNDLLQKYSTEPNNTHRPQIRHNDTITSFRCYKDSDTLEPTKDGQNNRTSAAILYDASNFNIEYSSIVPVCNKKILCGMRGGMQRLEWLRFIS